MPSYNTVAGFVQFDVNEREAAGQTVRDVVIQAVGSGGQNVKITVWPEFASAAIAKGDYVAAQGKFTSEKVGDKTYNNLSASSLYVNGTLYTKGEYTVDNAVEDEADEDSLF